MVQPAIWVPQRYDELRCGVVPSIAVIRAWFYLPTFEHVRDRAILKVHMATAFRLDTVRALPLAALNRLTGEVEVVTKGGKVMQWKSDTKTLGRNRSYLGLRPRDGQPALFVTATGKAISY